MQGAAKLPGGGEPVARTERNKANRVQHAGALRGSLKLILSGHIQQRGKRGPDAPAVPTGVPLLLEIEPTNDLDWLISALGVEIVSEEGDGYVIVASDDFDLAKFQKLLDDFEASRGKSGQAARVYSIAGEPERLERVLSAGLYKKWPTIDDTTTYTVDVALECLGKARIPKQPQRNKYADDQRYEKAVENWNKKADAANQSWDDLQDERQAQLDRFVRESGARILRLREGAGRTLTRLPDTIEARIELKGQHLRDLVQNFPYLLEVAEPVQVMRVPEAGAANAEESAHRLKLDSPLPDAPTIGVIDSGIQEEHRLLTPAIHSEQSRSFVPKETDETADYVIPGGHGTRVAGAILYGETIPRQGRFQTPFWLRNLRVLNKQNQLSKRQHPPSLLQSVVEASDGVRVFNHSINEGQPCRQKRMSAWAAAMDNLCFEEDVLFVQSVGNIKSADSRPGSYGVLEHINAGRAYPDYLSEKSCRLASPAESLQALTVGSVAYPPQHPHRFAGPDEPSCFSRSGHGIWGTIKPDVVEYGGDLCHDGNTPPRLVHHPESCPELVRATLHGGGPAFDRDQVGTSFAAPKVTRLAAELQQLLPDQPCLLYRALIANSARWPKWAEEQASETALGRIGYGIPQRDKALTNTPYRVTLITEGVAEVGLGEAHVYQIPVPPELRRADLENRIRVDVTLSYAARPRRTRRTIKRYLSTWLTWNVSKAGETLDSFVGRVLKEPEDAEPDGGDIFSWTLRERSDLGVVTGVHRHNSTLQKDWAVVPAYQLPDSFCLAVIGHRGWSQSPHDAAKYALAISFEAIDGDLEIYQPIRLQVEGARIRNRLEI